MLHWQDVSIERQRGGGEGEGARWSEGRLSSMSKRQPSEASHAGTWTVKPLIDWTFGHPKWKNKQNKTDTHTHTVHSHLGYSFVYGFHSGKHAHSINQKLFNETRVWRDDGLDPEKSPLCPSHTHTQCTMCLDPKPNLSFIPAILLDIASAQTSVVYTLHTHWRKVTILKRFPTNSHESANSELCFKQRLNITSMIGEQ